VDIDLTDGKDKGRHAQPNGYVPSHLAEPALRDRDQQRTALEYAAIELGEIRAGADVIRRADGNGPTARNARATAAREIEETATRVQRLLRAIVGGALVALVAVGLSVGGARPAAAATVPASAPAIEAPQPDTGIVQHSTKFGRGVWFDQGNGDLYVGAPLFELTARYGWLPSPWETVVVQESTRRGIRTRAILTRTNAEGIARGLFHIGGGVHYLRVLHPADLWTLGTVGTWRRVVVTTEPLDVD
jgi:hypothetical protein